MKLLINLKQILAKYLIQKQFVFTFEYYFKSGVINDTNVVEYRFINQGQSICVINGMELMPKGLAGAGVDIPPNNILLDIRENEKDVNQYRIKFLSIPCSQQGTATIRFNGFLSCAVLPPDPCVWNITFSINGILITGQLTTSCDHTDAQWATLFNSILLPQYAGAVFTVLQQPDGLYVTINNIIIPCGDHVFTGFFDLQPTPSPLCASYNSDLISEFWVTKEASIDKLLVVSKVAATVRTTKPDMTKGE